MLVKILTHLVFGLCRTDRSYLLVFSMVYTVIVLSVSTDKKNNQCAKSGDIFGALIKEEKKRKKFGQMYVGNN